MSTDDVIAAIERLGTEKRMDDLDRIAQVVRDHRHATWQDRLRQKWEVSKLKAALKAGVEILYVRYLDREHWEWDYLSIDGLKIGDKHDGHLDATPDQMQIVSEMWTLYDYKGLVHTVISSDDDWPVHVTYRLSLAESTEPETPTRS